MIPRDWKGNEIKAGMTVVYIRVRYDIPRYGIMMYDKRGNPSFIEGSNSGTSERCWIVEREQVVQQMGDRLGYVYTEKGAGEATGYTFSMPVYLDTDEVFTSGMPAVGGTHIIAIKGVSDINDIMPLTNNLINKALNKDNGTENS